MIEPVVSFPPPALLRLSHQNQKHIASLLPPTTAARCLLRLRPSLPRFSPPLLGQRRFLSPGASAVPGPACDCVDESRRLLFLPPTDTGVGAVAGLAGAGGCVGRRASPAAVRVDQDPHP